MAQLTEDMKEFIKNNLAWVATVNQDGIPDLGPKMSMFVLDDNHLAYHERTAGQTYRNLENGSPLVVAFANFEQKKGYRFRGEVVLHTDDAIYDEQVKLANERGTKVPACVPVLEISEIDEPLRRCKGRHGDLARLSHIPKMPKPVVWLRHFCSMRIDAG